MSFQLYNDNLYLLTWRSEQAWSLISLEWVSLDGRNITQQVQIGISQVVGALQ